jgi:hypothetical protein
MKLTLTFLMLLISCSLLSQKIGYEMRTNGKSYITFSHKITEKGGLELRHRTQTQNKVG